MPKVPTVIVDVYKRQPSATPAGIFTSTTSSPYTIPSPAQALHLFLIIFPSPLHCDKGADRNRMSRTALQAGDH